MKTVNIELFGALPLYLGMGIKIVVSIFLGGLIGFEREARLKSAGIRTNVLICLGATLYTALSLLNIPPEGMAWDPNRVAAQIVSGIGFLGAGAIIQSRGSVHGLTSAATIWVVAAVGMTVGMGYPLVATIFTFTVLLVLRTLRPLYNLLDRENTYHVMIKSDTDISQNLASYLTKSDLYFDNFTDQMNVVEGVQQFILNLDVKASTAELRKLMNSIRKLKGVRDVVSHVQIRDS